MNTYDTRNTSFRAHDIKISSLYKLTSFISATGSRRSTFRLFCASCGIELPINPSRNYILPKNFIIESARIKRHYRSRDKIIQDFYTDFRKAKQKIDTLISEVNSDIDQYEKYISSNKDLLHETELELAKEKASINIISLQGKCDNLKSLIKQKEVDLKEVKKQLARFQTINKDNFKEWDKQVDFIKEAISELNDAYVKRAGSKVTKQLDYNAFSYIEEPYNKSVRGILDTIKQWQSKA